MKYGFFLLVFLWSQVSYGSHFGLFFGRGFRANLDCSAEIFLAASATKVWNGSSYGPCTLNSCQAGFTINGSQCVPTGVANARQSFTTPGTYAYVVPAGVTKILVTAAGGGGGAGGSDNQGPGTSGGGASGGIPTVLTVVPGQTYTLYVGQGGGGGYGSGSAGSDGQATTFDSLLTIPGGYGGLGYGSGNVYSPDRYTSYPIPNSGVAGGGDKGSGGFGGGCGFCSGQYFYGASSGGGLPTAPVYASYSGSVGGPGGYYADNYDGGGGGGGNSSWGRGGNGASNLGSGESAPTTSYGAGGGGAGGTLGGWPRGGGNGAGGCIFIYY